MTPRISVITPSFNQGRFIERTIRSVLSQEVPDVEYVVYDGGSKDETIDVLRSFGEHLRWVSEPDAGQSDAVNKGIRGTRGEIIGWLNSDDIYYPGALQSVLECFDAHPEVDVVYGCSNHIDEKDADIEPYRTEPWSLDRMKETCVISQPAAFFRRRIVERWGALDVNLHYSMDYEFWLRLGMAGATFAYLPSVLAATRIHDQTKTNASRLKCHQEINAMLADKFGRVPDHWIFKYARAAVGDRGLTRKHSILYILMIMIYSHLSSLKWNHRLSWGVVQVSCRWMMNGVRRSLQTAKAS